MPWSRFKTPENTIEKNDNMSYEEYSFSRMIIRFQHRFAEGFKRGFITHLKLREIWDKEGYELQESDLKVEFVKPVLYDFYEIQKLVDTKMTIYKAFADNDELSKIIAMKKYLGFTEKDIEDNFKMLIKEKQLVAVADYFAEQITAENPPVDFTSPIRLKNDVLSQQQINQGKIGTDQAEGGEGEAGDEGGMDMGSETTDDTGSADVGGDEGGGDMGVLG